MASEDAAAAAADSRPMTMSLENISSTNLMFASAGGDLDAVKAALAGGANVNATYGSGSPLWFAAQGGHAEIVEVLLEAGAHPSPDGLAHLEEDPLFAAAREGRDECVRLLLKAGADHTRCEAEKGKPLVDLIKSDTTRTVLLLHLGFPRKPQWEADSSGTADDGAVPQLMGYMHKRGVRNPAFRHRFFVLHARRLWYFKSHRDVTSCKGFIDLSAVTAVEAVESGSESKEHAMRLITDGRVWVIASDAKNYDTWFTLLTKLSSSEDGDDGCLLEKDDEEEEEREEKEEEEVEEAGAPDTAAAGESKEEEVA
eukprot:PLAT6567.1.p2 GENE.PLAT6567.1~~PLAT6567.1.p2  ORF type:complete len:312 (+),score=135.01 PLAT6567.1:56-991(+)